MKILFVTDLYNICNNADAKALNRFVEGWRKAGHEVFVIRPNFLLNTLIRGKKILKEKLYCDDGVLNLNFLTPFWGRVENKLPKDFDINDFDVLISHMPSGALFSLKLLEKKKIPYCISVHASDIEVLTNPLYSFYFRNKLLKAYETADVIAPRSESLMKKIKDIVKTQKRFFIAPSGVREEDINCDVHKKISSPLKITTVSKLIKRKNVDVVLRALAQISEFDFEYRIIGDGKERKALEKLAKSLKIENKVKFIGAVSHDKVFEYLRESDIFVMLSRKETFGLVYLEAMASGNIVICTKDDGIDGIIKNSQNGFLCEAEPQKLKDLLIEVYNLSDGEIARILENTRKTAFENTEKMSCENYLKNLFN